MGVDASAVATIDAALDVGARLGRVGKALAAVHLELARRELARDTDRAVGGAIALAVGLSALAMAALLSQCAAVAALVHLAEVSWLLALGVVALVDLTIGAALVVIGKGRLRGPLLPQTRDLVKQTVGAFTGAE